MKSVLSLWYSNEIGFRFHDISRKLPPAFSRYRDNSQSWVFSRGNYVPRQVKFPLFCNHFTIFQWTRYKFYDISLKSVPSLWYFNEIGTRFMMFQCNRYPVYDISMKSAPAFMIFEGNRCDPYSHGTVRIRKVEFSLGKTTSHEKSSFLHLVFILRYSNETGINFMIFQWNMYPVYGISMKPILSSWYFVEIGSQFMIFQRNRLPFRWYFKEGITGILTVPW